MPWQRLSKFGSTQFGPIVHANIVVRAAHIKGKQQELPGEGVGGVAVGGNVPYIRLYICVYNSRSVAGDLGSKRLLLPVLLLTSAHQIAHKEKPPRSTPNRVDILGGRETGKEGETDREFTGQQQL